MGEARPIPPAKVTTTSTSTSTSSSDLADHIGKKAARKLRARRRSKTNSVWFGLGMMGLVGWSVVVPTLLGGALGVWIDKHHPMEHGLTLPLLMVGLAIGCINAWHWVAKEDAAMGDDDDDDDDDDTNSTRRHT